ncbi:uncharacterized protein LOC111260252 [Varroa jacobsoni]|uniref:uncharacterized protein LOC111260252 n=1 Tax=Varroa jacobsoni TaxID=62625 RepID=UPI000BF94C0B|nr:uncharacterized protein LOC111260252 [Varroa jacobsoni]XP_022688587.1 uncharacterized protein LOC111260252 [Varroa jacobsoni]XP_022688588.1 uncharacterized protein LOC111260252 [Varroa jacobsoni]
MKRLAIFTMALATVTLALDLEAVQRSSTRNRYSAMNGDLLHELEKRRSVAPNYFNMFDEPNGRMANDRYYRRMQELLANMVTATQGARGAAASESASWPDVLRQRDARLTQMDDIRPPYDQDDFPSYESATGRQDESLSRWTLPSPPPPSAGAGSPSGRQQSILDKRISIPDRQNSYRSHKQLPFSMRVPQEELLKKRSTELLTTEKPQTSRSDILIKDLKQPDMDKRNKRTAVPDAASSTVNTETNVSKASLSNGSGASGRMSPADFKQWLTDEYYRNMAMNFATMRKRRSVPDQAGLEGAPMEAPGERDDGAAFERLRSMEQSLLQEALQLMQNGNAQPGRGKQQFKLQVSERLDVAHDIENLNKALQKLYADSERLRTLNEAQLMTALRERAASAPEALGGVGAQLTDDCPELSLLSSGCSALQGMFPPASVHEQFLLSCNWHEVCYACGTQHGISSEQCDRQFLSDMRIVCSQLGSCNKHMVALLLEPLHKRRVYFKRSVTPVCDRPCVASFLARN